MNKFVNRLDEFDRLQTLYGSDAAELAIVYGRRQIGKSELVRRSIADRDDAVYFVPLAASGKRRRSTRLGSKSTGL